MVHQAGPHAVMEYLSTQESNRGVLFLTPCHGTPFYSHLHQDVPMEFLECPPHFNQPDYTNANDDFFRDPSNVIKTFDLNRFDYVVLYEKVLPLIIGDLRDANFQQCQRFWHTHFPESWTSSYLTVFCHDNGQ